MNTINAKIPEYGMPVLEGPVNKPEPVSMFGQMGGMPEGGMPPMAQDDMPVGEMLPPGAAPSQGPGPYFPTMRPSEHPGTVPGADVEPGTPGPGMPGGGPPKAPPCPRMDSIDVLDGKLYVADEPYAQLSGQLTDREMTNAVYKTDEVCLNGIYVGGDSVYAIKDSEFEMKGYGINDFAGIGSAVMVDDNAKCEMENVNITTYGVIRPCTTVTANGTLVVRNCVLDSRGGEIPAGYVPRVHAGMMEPPPGLKLGGNCRTHLSMGNSRAYFHDSKILAHSWAALSTDGSNGDQYLEANNCDVVCETVGYGTYADGGCHNVLNDCRITVDTHVAIIAGDAWVKLNNCTVRSNQYGAMLHGVRGHYTETTECHIVGGDWDVGQALFYVRSRDVYLKLDGAKVKTGKYLLHSVVNDDPARTTVPEELRLRSYGINAIIANGEYSGDIIHEDDERTMNVTLQNARVSGTIQDAYLKLDNSGWTATGDSSVALVGPVAVDQLDAPAGVTVFAKRGEGCALAGTCVLKSGGTLIVSE